MRFFLALPLPLAYWDGLTRATCWCDAAETTVNGHDPAHSGEFIIFSLKFRKKNHIQIQQKTIDKCVFFLSADQKCIEHHKFNETTQQCECEQQL